MTPSPPWGRDAKGTITTADFYEDLTDMTDHDDVAQRAYYQPDPGRIHIREEDDEEDGLFRVRMPISSTLEARDGEAFERDRLEGWATQINDGVVPVYGDHGRNPDIAGSRYSAFGKLGYYDDAEVREIEDHDGEYELVADTVMMDPDTLSEDTGALRENMARLKAQTERDMPITQSVGWSDSIGDRDVPGGSDLLEGSIVGIPSDGQASSHNAAVEMARTAMAADADRDPEQLVEDFRAVVMGPEQNRHLSTQQADLALQTVSEFRDEQGDASVGNFEEWLRMRWHSMDDNVIHATRTSLEEFHRSTTPLEEPVSEQFHGFLTEKADSDDRDTDNDMTDGTDSPDDGESGDGTREEDGISAEEFREQMLEMQRNQTDTLSTLAESLRADDDDDDDEDEEETDEDEDDDGDRTVTIDGEEMTAEDAVADLRDRMDDADPDTPGDDGEGDEGERDESDTETASDPKALL